MRYRTLRLVLCWSLIAVAAIAQESAQTNETVVVNSLETTNDVVVAQAVEAMAVEEEDEAAEAAEIAETVRRVEQERTSGPKEEVDPWDAFVPPVDSKFDWIQLTSSEWLKGDFKVMYDFTLEFDSDELGLLEFDLVDVQQLRTRAMKTVFVEGEGGRRDTSVLRGLLEMNGEQVVLRRSEHDVSIPRDKIISIASGRQRERDYWSGALSLGINARGGNTETIDTTVQARIRRRTVRTRFQADYLANYSATKGIDTANNQRLSGFHDWFLTSRFYWKTVEGEVYRDPFTNIDAQFSASTGVGYDLIRTHRTEWTVNTGIGYQEMRFVSVQPGEEESSSSPFLTAGTRLDYELTDDIDILYDYSLRVLNEENGKYTHHMLGTMSFDIIGDLDLDLTLIWDRIEAPQLDADGILPKQDDYQLIVSLTYDF
jgi:hypothetical protein